MRNVGREKKSMPLWKLFEKRGRNFSHSHLLIAYSFSTGPGKLELFFIIRRRIVCDLKRLIRYRIVFVEKSKNTKAHSQYLRDKYILERTCKVLLLAFYLKISTLLHRTKVVTKKYRWVCGIPPKKKVAGNFVCRKKEMKV